MYGAAILDPEVVARFFQLSEAELRGWSSLNVQPATQKFRLPNSNGRKCCILLIIWKKCLSHTGQPKQAGTEDGIPGVEQSGAGLTCGLWPRPRPSSRRCHPSTSWRWWSSPLRSPPEDRNTASTMGHGNEGDRERHTHRDREWVKRREKAEAKDWERNN